MNNQINKLFGKALDSAVPETWTTLTPEQLCRFKTKFAELIVKECSNVAWQHTPETEELEYSHLIKDKILEHFGVK